jgi:crotonobetainyl-CoA:carnitine CoA-transferase CaiB-like acyl-CoA transferase
MPESALSGLNVLEFGNLVSAPYCAKLLADLGAEVIKAEAPGLGDEARRREPFAEDRPGIERSGLFAYLNANKRSITLDPHTAAGKKLFIELVKKADILVENNPPSLMEKLGLTYDALEKINPMLVMTSITPFGQTGPHRDYKAYELTVYHGGGYGYLSTGCFSEPVMPPIKAGGRQAQFGAGQVGTAATLFAVLARDQIGAGQHVDISNQEVLAGLYESAIEHWTFTANEIGGVTNPVVQPMLPLQCKDGWVFIMCIEDFQFNNFVKVMGNPEWAKNELFKDRFSRASYIDALTPLLTEWTMQYTKDEVFRMAQAGHVPLAPAYTAQEVVNSPQISARNYFVEIDHPEIGRVRYPGAPYTLSETPWRIVRRAPLLGEHNEEIYCGRLGYTRQDLVKLTAAGVI